MANWWQVQLLKRGVKGWNRWRAKHPDRNSDLSYANLSKVNLSGANLSGANLSHAGLFGARLDFANLSHANLNCACLINANLRHTDLVGAYLIETFLMGSCLEEANLMGAHLARAHLQGADLSGAKLRDADLSGADLNADLSGADLSSADLSGTRLHNATLSGTNLNETDLSGAIFERTVLIDMDFRLTKGLARIYHLGPSVIHLPTLRLPQDSSALHFLQGVGLTDEYIDFWRSTGMCPIQYYSVFISYSNKNQTLAYRLHADLQACGVRCWFAPEDMKIGNKIRDHIDKAIHQQDKLLLLLSEHSIASTWVENEVEAALEKEDRQQREVLFPIRLDDAVMQTSQAWAATLRRTRHIGDFTNCAEPHAYQNAFDRLLQDLKQH